MRHSALKSGLLPVKIGRAAGEEPLLAVNRHTGLMATALPAQKPMGLNFTP